MTNDLQVLIEGLRGLAARADQLARSIEQQRTVLHAGRVGMESIETPARTAGVMVSQATAMASVARLGQSCREFRNSVEAAIEGLPPGLRS
jgi:hypothetical protein